MLQLSQYTLVEPPEQLLQVESQVVHVKSLEFSRKLPSGQDAVQVLETNQ